MYRWVVFAHVLAALAFMAAHGVSIALCFRIRAARTPEAVRPLLDMSASTLGAMYGAFALVALSGIAAGIWGQWWRMGWFWASVVVLVAVVGVMARYGAITFHAIRRAAGLPYLGEGRRPQPPLPAPDVPEMLRLIDATRPGLLVLVGLGGVVVLTWLMMFKPF